jgi:hypothetical protein
MQVTVEDSILGTLSWNLPSGISDVISHIPREIQKIFLEDMTAMTLKFIETLVGTLSEKDVKPALDGLRNTLNNFPIDRANAIDSTGTRVAAKSPTRH